MSETEEKTLASIRTFAKDLEAERKRRGQTTNKADVTSKKEPAEKDSVDNSDDKVSSSESVPPQTTKKDEGQKTDLEQKSKLQKEIDNKLKGVEVPAKRPAPLVSKKSFKHIDDSRLKARSFANGGATIIKDTKSNKGNIFGKIGAALALWLKSFSNKKNKSSNTYSVPSVERRKGIIQTATTKSGATFSADNEALRKAIKERKNRETNPVADSSKSVLIKPSQDWKQQMPEELLKEPEAEKEKPTPILETPEKEEISVKPIKIEPITPSQSNEKPLDTTLSEEKEINEETKVIHEKDEKKPDPEPKKKVNIEDLQPTTASLPIKPASAPSRPKIGLLKKIKNLPDFTTNTLSITAVSIVFIVLVLTFSIRGIMNIVAPPVTEEAPTVSSYSILPNTNVLDETVTTDVPSEFIDQVRSIQLGSTAPATEVRFVNVVGQPINPSIIVNLFSFTFDKNLTNTISDIRLVFINPLEMGLLMRVGDFSTAKGALLEWESLMPEELDPILNLQTLMGPSQFVDREIGGRDGRVLVQNGIEIMVYGFIDDNTVLITRDLDTFSDIINQSY